VFIGEDGEVGEVLLVAVVLGEAEMRPEGGQCGPTMIECPAVGGDLMTTLGEEPLRVSARSQGTGCSRDSGPL
jgi:hypothetical protein